MSANDDTTNDTKFVVSDNKRPGVNAYGVNYKFSPGDKVYVLNAGGKAGPYKVESADDGKYVLCDDYGITANGGQSYLENELELYDPFA